MYIHKKGLKTKGFISIIEWSIFTKLTNALKPVELPTRTHIHKPSSITKRLNQRTK